jgi:hypothetical protein
MMLYIFPNIFRYVLSDGSEKISLLPQMTSLHVLFNSPKFLIKLICYLKKKILNPASCISSRYLFSVFKAPYQKVTAKSW